MCCYSAIMQHITRESNLEKYLVREIRARGGLCIKMTNMSGIPDRLVILPDLIVFVELKTDRGRLSKIQKHVIKLLSALGCHVEVLYGRDQIKEFLEHVA